MKFKVGDKVIGNKHANAHYCITREGWIGTVTKLGSNGYFYATGKFSRGGLGFSLNESYFDLLETNSKIVITTDGKKTTAKLYEGDKVIKSASARCNPEDKFDFDTGAKLAFERLMGEEKIESKYKSGDKVTVISDNCHHFNKIGAVLTLMNRARWNDSGNDLAWYVEENSTYIRESNFKPYVELYNGKVVCIDNRNNESNYTVGKIYQFKDGQIITDSGSKITGWHDGIRNFDEWAKFTSSKFIEIKE